MEGRPELIGRQLLRAARAVAGHPSLWPVALAEARALARRGWWRRPPFLPVPDRELLAFRMTTAYGDPRAPLAARDLLTWLRWCRDWRRRHRWDRGARRTRRWADHG